jgi:hypothetical protein
LEVARSGDLLALRAFVGEFVAAAPVAVAIGGVA